MSNIKLWDWLRGSDSKQYKSEFGSLPLSFSKAYYMIDKLFGDISKEFHKYPTEQKDLYVPNMIPKINISETDDEYKISAEMPGISEKDINISVNNHMLEMKAEKKHEKEDKNEKYHCVESYVGTFERTVALPEDANEDKIEAKFKNGVLNIVIKKDEKKKKSAKKIELKSD